MKKLNANAQRKPIGGHHFTTHGQIIKSDTFEELIEAVKEYRLANSFDLGDPEAEVLGYYESIAPWLVVDDGKPSRPVGIPAHVKGLKDWIASMRKDPSAGILVSKTEAKERWEGCKGCKYASDIDWEYSEETEELERKAALLRGMRDTPFNDSYCRLHKWATGAAVYTRNPKRLEANKERSPEKCFVKKL